MQKVTVATAEQTLAMLEQEYLIKKYGLPYPVIKFETNENITTQSAYGHSELEETKSQAFEDNTANEIISAKILKKRVAKAKYQDWVVFNVQFSDSWFILFFY